jgi:hypothetical protein
MAIRLPIVGLMRGDGSRAQGHDLVKKPQLERDIAAELEVAGHVAPGGNRYTATAVSRMIAA